MHGLIRGILNLLPGSPDDIIVGDMKTNIMRHHEIQQLEIVRVDGAVNRKALVSISRIQDFTNVNIQFLSFVDQLINRLVITNTAGNVIRGSSFFVF